MPIDDFRQMNPGDSVTTGVRRALLFLGNDTLVALNGLVAPTRISFLREPRQQRFHGRLDIPHEAERYGMASSEMRRIEIDLNDLGVIRIVLAPGKIGAEQ